MDIKYWLRKAPQPHSVICDGRTIQVGKGPRRWAEMAETILSMGGGRLEALAQNGDVLRVVEIEPGGEDGKPEVKEERRQNLSGLSDTAQLASIIGDVSDRAAKRHQEAYQMAFDKLALIVTSMTERMVAVEQSWVESLNAIAELRMQLADAQSAQNESDISEIIGQVAGAYSAGQTSKKAKLNLPNGKHKKENGAPS